MRPNKTALAVVFLAWAGWPVQPARASGPLETETARTLPAGHFEAEFEQETQFSPDGWESAIPLAIEYGLTDDFSLLIEPVPYTAIVPTTGRRAYGLGDVEVTATMRFVRETTYLPDLALGMEVKLPTAQDALIGTGQTDYTGYFIVSKALGPVDVHLNAAYTVMGQIPGLNINNTFDFGAAVEWFINDSWDVMAEMVGNTAATSEGEMPESQTAVTPEVAGFEIVGMVGARWHATKHWALCLGATYDNNDAFLIRQGFLWSFGL